MKAQPVILLLILAYCHFCCAENISNWTYIRTFIEVSNKDSTGFLKLAVTYGVPIPASNLSVLSVPVVVETLPYRKDDSEYITRFEIIDYFASHGFAYAYVDIRGTGGSDGPRVSYEYSDIEIEDLIQIIEKVTF